MILSMWSMIMTCKSVLPQASFKELLSIFSNLCPTSSSDSQFQQPEGLSAHWRSCSANEAARELPDSKKGAAVHVEVLCVWEGVQGENKRPFRMGLQQLWSKAA